MYVLKMAKATRNHATAFGAFVAVPAASASAKVFETDAERRSV
jgi:hypothetical protein